MENSNLPKEMLFDKNLTQEQIELLISQYNRFLSISKLDIHNNQLEIENKEVVLPMGTLLYLCDFSNLYDIVQNGILAKEFYSKNSSDGNFYSAFFYRVKKKMALNKYVETFLESKLTKNDDIAIIINPTSKIGSLLYYDLYDIKYDSKDNIRGIINIDSNNKKYISSNRGEAACILAGLPSNVISGVLVNDRIVLDEEKIKMIKKLLPEAFIVTSDGNIIKDRSNTINIDDFDELSLKYCDAIVKNKMLENSIKREKVKYSKLKEGIEGYMEAVKEIIPAYEQAKLFVKLGYTDIPKSIKSQLSKEELSSLQKKDK